MKTFALSITASLAAMALTTIGARAVPTIATSDVAQLCEQGFAIGTTDAPTSARKATCIAYLDAVVASILQVGALATQGEKRTLFCLPEAVSYDELARVFVGFAKKNRSYDERAAASVVIAAYADHYPCKNS